MGEPGLPSGGENGRRTGIQNPKVRGTGRKIIPGVTQKYVMTLSVIQSKNNSGTRGR